MSFAEFQIRLFAYKRVQEREWEKVRIIAWYAMTGSHQDPKKMPKNITSFMRLDLDEVNKNRIGNEAKNHFLKKYKEYLEKK
jgi:hypothetical protein